MAIWWNFSAFRIFPSPHNAQGSPDSVDTCKHARTRLSTHTRETDWTGVYTAEHLHEKCVG